MLSARHAIPGAVLVLLSLATPLAPAFAAGGEGGDPSTPASTLDIAYNLYVGGISLGRVAMNARVQGDNYKAISTLETKGIVNAFWQAKIETSSNGTLTGQRVQPALYDSFSQNRSNPRQQVTMTFGPEGPKSVTADPPYHDKPVPDNDLRQTLDPLSAMVFLTNSVAANRQKPCGVTAPVYDGRRRYDIAFNFVKKTDVNLDNGLYAGPAMVCQIHYNQIAGYKQKIVEEGKKLPNMYAWVAPLHAADDSGHPYMIPLRIWAETDYGIVVALVSELKIDGASPAKGS